MKRLTVSLSFLLFVLALLFAAGCQSANVTGEYAPEAGSRVDQTEGFTVEADPVDVVIDLTDPNTPSDPDTGKAFGETTLTATLLDSEGAPRAGEEITFGSSAGSLASEGQPLTTDENGQVTDTLRVFEDDPDSIDVTATAGEETATTTVTKTLILPNEPPVADAGEDQTVECAAPEGNLITLDGSGSSDPDSSPGTNDDIVSFEWSEGGVALGDGETLEVTLAPGTHTITLTVTDSEGETDTDEVVITIEDTTPPTISVELDPSVLWPPNHKMVDVHATVTVEDACSVPAVVLESAVSSEPDDAKGIGDGSTVNDIQGADLGTEDYDLMLRAERAGRGPGRVYTVTYSATDDAGNASTADAEVHVPHDQGG